MAITIIRTPTTLEALRALASEGFGEYVKAVVDVRNGCMAVGGDMHADEEAVLIDDGAAQTDLWGINIYPDLPDGQRVEFDSMINVRPREGNRSRDVESAELRGSILRIVAALVKE